MFTNLRFDSFYKKLLDIRKNELGISRKYVSELSGINIDTIRNIENGKCIPKLDTLEALSYVYKRNLVELFNSYKGDKNYINFYKKIDGYLSNYNISSLNNLKSEYENFKNSLNESDLLIRKEENQLELFIQSQELIYSDLDNKYELSSNMLIQAIQVTIPNFKIENWKDYSYNYFEYRILYSISSTMIKDKKNNTAKEILLFLYNKMEKDNNEGVFEICLTIRIIALISHSYHIEDNYIESLKFSNIGIDYCNKNQYDDNKAFLLSRKGVALYYTNDPEYKTFLKGAVYQLFLKNNLQLANIYINTNKLYGVKESEYDIDIINKINEFNH